MNKYAKIIDFPDKELIVGKTYSELLDCLIAKGYEPHDFYNVKIKNVDEILFTKFRLTEYNNMYHLCYWITKRGHYISSFNLNKLAQIQPIEDIIFND